MLPLKILIADDEKEARELLLHFLNSDKVLFNIEEVADGISALNSLERFQPDILFLDIKMPEFSGIEVLQKRAVTPLPAIIFTTAYDEYALPAFDFEAVDYLLKPFEKERFDKALKKAILYVDVVKNRPAGYPTQLTVKTGNKTELVATSEILYFQAEGAYVQVVTANKFFLITEPLYELESRLDPKQFIRIHRSVIVNIYYIKSIHSLLNGDHQLILKNGKELRVSRTYREKIKGLFKTRS
jgi:two-component system LytT family response regulator